MRARIIVAVALAALGVSACIIGPKQDDPSGANETIADTDPDAGAALDDLGVADSGDFATDTAAPTTVPDGGAADAAVDGAPKGDALSDGDVGCGDGSVPLTASGPWNETKKCWASTVHTFECVSGIDGGTALTCFVRISTGEKFLAPSTHIPSGPDYRVCKDGEGGGPYDRCE